EKLTGRAAALLPALHEAIAAEAIPPNPSVKRIRTWARDYLHEPLGVPTAQASRDAETALHRLTDPAQEAPQPHTTEPTKPSLPPAVPAAVAAAPIPPTPSVTPIRPWARAYLHDPLGVPTAQALRDAVTGLHLITDPAQEVP